ncbi:PREDICTED: CSC1-like protein RXW8 [Populus euphratica]|uniref:CSC1-like protein RXW8 n=1 Tax=Populus euphratica TaxID=75702 RepID=A0AAJ6TSZ5_POPEU|nr:PREDICTED: CSC1-like protein RXW8 [Populus euphratica]XP_011017062.1 PREDICTED: CSC1-like protein RXW8 [Populus euphratica]
MDIGALLTSAAINTGLSVLLFSLYSILRKQPSNTIVYFGRRLASLNNRNSRNHFSFERFVPSPSWIVKAWETTENEILAIGGLDAVVFQRILVFSIRVFSIAAVTCMFLVLPVNYYGQEMKHKHIHAESLNVFTIANVKEGSRWLWAHCLALYIISCSACVLLYFEYKSITKMRLAHITTSPPNPSHFTILVRSIPYSVGESYSNSVKKFFTNYYASSYLSHQIVYRCGLVQKLMVDAEKICMRIKAAPKGQSSLKPCCLCGGSTSFKVLTDEPESVKDSFSYSNLNLATRDNERSAAFVIFKTRYAAVVATQMLQSPNPMSWVTELAPEPHDVLWSNLCIPFRQLWLRKIATLLASIVFMVLFLAPVTFVQGLTQLEKLSQTFPFLRGFLKQDLINHVLTGYLPSVILILFLYTVPPTMMLFSSVEGPVSHSGRKRSACLKILYFTIWNVFFVNHVSGGFLFAFNMLSSVGDIPVELAKAIPNQASFFVTYVLTSGWASLSCEVMQPFSLLCNFLKKHLLRNHEDSSDGLVSFPYHTEVPRVLLFGLIGFTYSVMAPLILPFLLIYFLLAYLVYRNQIVNVYITKYEGGGQLWPIVHNTTIFSLVLTQMISLGVFGIKKSPVASGFTIPLIICTLLFNEYCRQRFFPIFKKNVAQVLLEMDRRDEQSGRMDEIHQQLHSAYCQLPLTSHEFCESVHKLCQDNIRGREGTKSGKEPSEVSEPCAVCNFGKERSIGE